MKYFSYGMNTNLASMAVRCPGAQSLGAAVLPHYEFEFKSFATIAPKMGAETNGVLWEITPECEKSLDRLEGYPVYYGKIIVWVEHDGVLTPAMTYLMYPEEEPNYPSNSYVTMLEEGYTAHGISTDQINQALVQLNNHFGLTSDLNDATLYSYN